MTDQHGIRPPDFRKPPGVWRKPEAPRKRPMRRLVFWALFLVLLLAGLGWFYPARLFSGPGQILSLLTLVTIGSLIVFSLRLHFREFLRYLAIWMAIILALAIGWAFRHEIGGLAGRVAGSGIPERGFASGEAMAFERGRDGHFRVRALVNDVAIDFLVDTGASHVVLTPKDAARLGISPLREQYFERYQTANGVVHAAPVMLDHLAIGETIRLEMVRASVTEGELSVSLLGMSLLERLGGFEMRGDRLLLYP